MMPTVYHFSFAKTGNGISGGEKCLLELVHFLKEKNYRNVILTTDNGAQTYKKSGLKPSKYIKYIYINSYKDEISKGLLISYFIRTFKAVKLINELNIDNNSIIICHSNFYPNYIPAYFMERRNKYSKIFYWHHVIPPKLKYGYFGENNKHLNFPNIKLVHYKLSHRLYLTLHNKKGIIITPNISYKEILQSIKSKNKIVLLKPFGGLDRDFKHIKVYKKYDIAWMGRFQKLKGIDDFIEIISKISKYNSKISVLVIGGGNDLENRTFMNKINNYKLKNNITFKPHLVGKDRYKELSKAKIFVSTSYFESYGLSLIEALKLGLPIFIYDLPSLKHINHAVTRIDIGNIDQFAKKLTLLLSNNRAIKLQSKEAVNSTKTYSWDNTFNPLLESINSKTQLNEK